MSLRPSSIFVALLGLAAWLGCNHAEAFVPTDHGSDQPFAPGPPTRLTLNPLTDLRPSWLPDGTGILYGYEVVGRADRDRCLAILPASGGTRQLEICDPKPESVDTADAYSAPAASDAGVLAYVLDRSPANSLVPSRSALEVAPLSQPLNATVIQVIPYTLPTGEMHQAVSHVSWLDQDHLVYVGQQVFYPRACSTCPADTLATGRDLVLVDLGGSSPRLSVVPGTALASSVAPGPTPTSIYDPDSGQARRDRRDRGAGAGAVVHDFGPGRIARDVHVVGTTLVAVVGGKVVFFTDPVFGPVQPDDGGTLTLIDLSTAQETRLDPSGQRLYRRPALSPDGTRLAVEAYDFTLVSSGGVVDTIVDRRADIWLFGAP